MSSLLSPSIPSPFSLVLSSWIKVSFGILEGQVFLEHQIVPFPVIFVFQLFVTLLRYFRFVGPTTSPSPLSLSCKESPTCPFGRGGRVSLSVLSDLLVARKEWSHVFTFKVTHLLTLSLIVNNSRAPKAHITSTRRPSRIVCHFTGFSTGTFRLPFGSPPSRPYMH